MNQIVLLPAATAASDEDLTFFDSSQYEGFTVACDVLAGAEVCPIYMELGGVMRGQFNDAGTTLQLTATKTSLWLVGGPKYGFAKSVTAGACAIYVIPGPRVNR